MSRDEEKKRGGWQAVVKHLGAHMHEPVYDDRLDRALVTMSGQLPRNAPYLEMSLDLDLRRGEQVTATSISAQGMVAVAIEGEEHLRLVTWSRWTGLSTDIVSTVGGGETRTCFASESNETILESGSHLFWGSKTTVPLPTAHGLPSDDACVVGWQEEDDSTRCAFIKDGLTHVGSFWKPGESEIPVKILPERVRWQTHLGGQLIRVPAYRGGGQGDACLYLSEKEVPIASGHSIFTNQQNHNPAIGVADGGVQFAAAPPGGGYAAHIVRNGEDRFVPVSTAKLVSADGRLYQIKHGYNGPDQVTALWEGDDGVRWNAPKNTLPNVDSNYLCPSTLRLFRFGSLIVVANLGHDQHRGMCVMSADGEASRHALGSSGVERFHHGLGFIEMDLNRQEVLRWGIPRVGNAASEYLEFPLYHIPSDRLTAVQDRRGKSIMSCNASGNTLHIIRYPLPG